MEKRRVVSATAVICVILVAGYLIAALFAPGLKYRVVQPPAEALNAPQYLRILEALVDARVTRNNRIEVLTHGKQYYPTELQAIRNAKQSVNIEAYIFQSGRVTRQFVDALNERAKAGVKVRKFSSMPWELGDAQRLLPRPYPGRWTDRVVSSDSRVQLDPREQPHAPGNDHY